MEKNLTIQDLIDMGYNVEALKDWYKGIYTEEELKQILYGELNIMYLESSGLPEYRDSKLIPNYKNKESFMKKLIRR